MGLLNIIKGVFSSKGDVYRPPLEPARVVQDTTSQTQEIFGIEEEKKENLQLHDEEKRTRVLVQQTPNPRAFKFITESPMKLVGKVTYTQKSQAEKNPLALAIFDVPGVSQLHFFDNVVTVTLAEDVLITEAVDRVRDLIERLAADHNPDFETGQDEEKRRAALSPELQKIEEILDRTIRPGLKADGGDLEVLALEKENLMVRYQGACGSCPSSTTGTLMAIESILREEFNPEIKLIAI